MIYLILFHFITAIGVPVLLEVNTKVILLKIKILGELVFLL